MNATMNKEKNKELFSEGDSRFGEGGEDERVKAFERQFSGESKTEREKGGHAHIC